MPNSVPPNVDDLRESLRAVIDPELGLDIVTLGLVYEVTVEPDSAVAVRMTMTSRGCPMQGIIAASTRSVLKNQPGVGEVTVDVVWEPAWTPDRIELQGREFLGV